MGIDIALQLVYITRRWSAWRQGVGELTPRAGDAARAAVLCCALFLGCALPRQKLTPHQPFVPPTPQKTVQRADDGSAMPVVMAPNGVPYVISEPGTEYDVR